MTPNPAPTSKFGRKHTSHTYDISGNLKTNLPDHLFAISTVLNPEKSEKIASLEPGLISRSGDSAPTEQQLASFIPFPCFSWHRVAASVDDRQASGIHKQMNASIPEPQRNSNVPTNGLESRKQQHCCIFHRSSASFACLGAYGSPVWCLLKKCHGNCDRYTNLARV